MTRLIAGLAALLVALCFATGAWAHASLVSAEPADGSVLSEAPTTVQLRFNENVAPAVASLIDAAGKAHDVTMRAVDQSVVIALPEKLPRGTQVLSYRVVSQDGHPVAGSLVFSIGAVTGTAMPTNAGAISVTTVSLIWLARIGVYLGLFVGVGGVFFAAWIGYGPYGATTILGSLALGVAGAVASLGLQGIDLLNLPLTALATLAPWKAALGTSLGPSMLIAIAAMAVARFAWQSPTMTVAWGLTSLAMIGVGFSLATSGHAATAPPQWLTPTLVFVHGIAVAYWVGALAPLVVMARRRHNALPRALRQFSAAAVPLVGLLVLTGLVLAIIQLESFRALIDTWYGIILLVKLVLVVLLLALAVLNRFFLTPAVVLDGENTRTLGGSVFLEFLLVVGILIAVAGWRFTTPPRALADSAATPLAVHIHTETAMFQVLISPGKVGSDDFVLQLMTGDGSKLPAKEATLTLSLPERGIEPIERNAVLGPDGYWHVRGVPLPQPGRWHMQIDALVTDFEKVTLEDDFEVR
ncbi:MULTISPECIES: copper resistance CopC/CopD family protein [Bradyrhizobium]|jgi:copper transport protein|uniref:Copper transport protein n=2 Tax=Bradyrhizobium TaxID=374 RepID=A0ABY0QF32_9BRAD|nr:MULTISPECIES: copper resistance protein CopC [Bradyrhizobium]SDK12350.1 copper transport protein [Bradyrhizobium ottawaense]SEE78188.1 copper transport protein [Bradyrhizobium lablabi]